MFLVRSKMARKILSQSSQIAEEAVCKDHFPAVVPARIKYFFRQLLLLLLHLIQLLCGVDVRWHTPPCSTVVHFISRQSILFDVIIYFVQPSSLRSSSLPSPLYFRFHSFPSYAVFLSSHYMSIPLQPPFLDFLCDFPTFVVLLILSFLILSSFVTPHIHRSILISATSNFFSCAFVNAHISAPYISAGLTTVLNTSPWSSRSFSCRTTLQKLSSSCHFSCSKIFWSRSNNICTPPSLRLFQTSTGILSGPIAFPCFIPFFRQLLEGLNHLPVKKIPERVSPLGNWRYFNMGSLSTNLKCGLLNSKVTFANEEQEIGGIVTWVPSRRVVQESTFHRKELCKSHRWQSKGQWWYHLPYQSSLCHLLSCHAW